jgi:hypothetical protein
LAVSREERNMTGKEDFRGFFWVAGGMVLLILVGMLLWSGHREKDVATRAAFKAKRVRLVGTMRASLSAASEAEMSAVMATTDEESRAFADRARVAATAAEHAQDDLARILEAGGAGRERELLSEVSRSLTECRRIDDKLLNLAVRNTNLKAYALATGPAAAVLRDMDRALSNILKEGATSSAPEAKRMMLLAAGAQSGAWRIQSLLMPHISEERDQRMDSLEVRIADEDRAVLSDLKGLATLLRSGNHDLETARSSYGRFTELRTQILDLSRQNTNALSLFISLTEKRKAVQVCQDALSALEQEILQEPLAYEEQANHK